MSHPSISVPVAEVPYSRIGNLAIPGDKLTFGELEAIIVVDENMNSYTEMATQRSLFLTRARLRRLKTESTHDVDQAISQRIALAARRVLPPL